MKLTTNTILIVFGIMALLILACLPITYLAMPLLPSNPVPTYNSAATVQAMVTQTMYAITQAAPTQTPFPPTPTTVVPTNTPVPTSTPVSYCDWVEFIKDVSIPDGSVFAPGDSFTKIWRLKNRGTCAWTPDYKLVFASGAQMSGPSVIAIPGYVAPGQTVDISVTLTAPAAPGRYIGYWMLRNPSGSWFGYGNKADTAFYVDISTKSVLPHGTVTGNLCYPSEFNPPLTLYFERAGTGERIQFSIPENQNVYSVLLPNGTYYAYAWAPGYNLEGAYVNAQGVMKLFDVDGGLTTVNINLCDWSPYPHARGQ